MDFQSIIDSYLAMSCVVSVERKSDGGYGDIRIVAGNAAFRFPSHRGRFSGSFQAIEPSL